jgi:hypothetical protein
MRARDAAQQQTDLLNASIGALTDMEASLTRKVAGLQRELDDLRQRFASVVS